MITRPARKQGFKRDRAALRGPGMRLLRLWAPNPRSVAFRRAADRQASLLRGTPEELEALEFIASTADWPDPET